MHRVVINTFNPFHCPGLSPNLGYTVCKLHVEELNYSNLASLPNYVLWVAVALLPIVFDKILVKLNVFKWNIC